MLLVSMKICMWSMLVLPTQVWWNSAWGVIAVDLKDTSGETPNVETSTSRDRGLLDVVDAKSVEREMNDVPFEFNMPLKVQ